MAGGIPYPEHNMPLPTTFTALRDRYTAPRYVNYPLTQVRLADAIVLDVPDQVVTIDRRHLEKVSLWAPDGILRVPEAGTHACPGPNTITHVIAFLTGALLGAAIIAAPVTTFVIAVGAGAFLLLPTCGHCPTRAPAPASV